MTLRLENKIALVTGAGSGIGKAICLGFAAQGAKIVVTDIDETTANATAQEINNNGGKAIAFKHDSSSESQWQAAIDETLSKFNKLDVLVNNAGILFPGSIEDTTLEMWEKTERVNSQGVFLGTRIAIAAMKASKSGSIINVSSIDGLVGEPAAAAYGASKGAVRLLSKASAVHCAEAGYNIRVNSIHPGYVLTPLVENALAQLSPEDLENFKIKKLGSIPMGRMGETHEIAMGCIFLASDESSYMTGAELVMDGGFTAT